VDESSSVRSAAEAEAVLPVIIGRWLRRVFGGMAAVVLSVLMLVVLVDALGRSLFSTPVPGGAEIIGFLLTALIFLGLPLVTAGAGHIAVNLLETRLPPGWRRYQEQSVSLISILAFATLSWLLWQYAFPGAEGQDSSTRHQLQPSFFWLVLLMALTSTLSTGLLVLMLVTGRKRLMARNANGYQA